MSEEIRFEVEGKEYYIKPIDSKIITAGQKVYNSRFRKAIEEGCLLKKKLELYLREQGLWSDSQENEYKTLVKQIADYEFKLNTGGFKISEARDFALKLRATRNALRDLITERSKIESNTAEGQAESERFNYFVSACIYDFLTRKPVFKSLDDYLENIESPVANAGTNKLASYLYGLEDNYEDSLTENKFLKRFKFLDDRGRLINKDQHLVDEEGNLIDEEGYRIDENGVRIDINNNPIPSTTVEDAEFVDDVFSG